MICSDGNGLTAGSSVLVRKSQKILGQKKPDRAAAIWSDGRLASCVPICSLGLGEPTHSCAQGDEPRPVVLNQSSHFPCSFW